MKIKHLLWYCGPNRRSDRTLVEILLEFSGQDLEAIAGAGAAAPARMQGLLAAAGIEPGWLADPATEARDDTRVLFGEWCAAAGLALQRAAGHDVRASSVLTDPRPRCTVLFEHEESSVGERAGWLALELAVRAIPGLDCADATGNGGEDFAGRCRDFIDDARGLVQPADTGAIIEAARALGVPAIKLERDPYEPVQGEFRIRMNSMLMLGHAAQRKLIDGTFAIEQSARAAGLLFERAAAMQALSRAGLPVPPSDRDFRPCLSAARAERAARRIGYPVAVKPARRHHGRGVALPVSGPQELAAAYAQAARGSDGVIVEGFVEGATFRLLIAGHDLAGVTTAAGEPVDSGRLHQSIVRAAVALSRNLGVGLLALTVVTPDPSRPLEYNGGAAVDVEVAPRLDRITGGNRALMNAAAAGFVRWLFPAGTRQRIPVISITGTNGKTTTSRMTAAITMAAGYATGLICTDGRYFNGRLLEAGDQSTFIGHYRIFEMPDAEIGVFETHHRGMAVYGFAFERCEVAVCTNVTDDHIGEFGIDSVAEMAELKRSLLERASQAVVLNADDEHCRAMLPHLPPVRVCLTSMAGGRDELPRPPGSGTCCCILEIRDGEEWIVLRDGGREHAVIPVRKIPATFGGAARFNVANALSATAAAWCMGIEPGVIARALGAFETGFEQTPWRMNEFHGLPFRVLVDFAHNPDGVRQIADFARRTPVDGKRTLAYSGWKSDAFIQATAAAAAGAFDRYVLKNYTPVPGYSEEITRQPDEVPVLMKAALLEAGVHEAQITTVTLEADGIRHALETARAGDLVIILVGYEGLKIVREILESFRAAAGDG